MESARDFTVQAESVFRSAAGVRGMIRKDYRIGGQRMRFRFAGPELLEPLARALAHLEIQEEADPRPDLTVSFWERSAADEILNAPTWWQSDAEWDGDARVGTRGALTIIYQAPAGGLMSAVDVEGARAFVVCADASRIPYWDIATPLRALLNFWLGRLGGQIVHGAAIGNATHGVLLAGLGGSGKSSTALKCLSVPTLYHLADDLCLIQNTADDLIIHSLYNSAKLERDNLGRFQNMDLAFSEGSRLAEDKPTFFLHPAYASQLTHSRPLRAILLPRITGQRKTSIVETGRAEAWRALAPLSVHLVPGDVRRALATITEAIGRVPVFRLELGTDREAIPPRLARFMESL